MCDLKFFLQKKTCFFLYFYILRIFSQSKIKYIIIVFSDNCVYKIKLTSFFFPASFFTTKIIKIYYCFLTPSFHFALLTIKKAFEASLKNASRLVSFQDISRQRHLCCKRYGTVGADSLAGVDVWKWHHFMSSVHESGIASPVNGMNYVWQEKVKAVFCIICRLLSKLTFGQPFAGFRRGSGLI